MKAHAFYCVLAVRLLLVLLLLLVPPGDDKLRPVCENCGFINYKNPKIVVGCVVADSMGHILLGKRGIQPRHGYWGLPGGFMESHESLEDGMFVGWCHAVQMHTVCVP